ncbi:Chaperone protein HscA [Candidatus Trichorickettsia mobilis]|uniref:Chaperone protein HscA n=1 Tax=Candidatus Trichorickettsia mobilis TaxID=1346319 RepID=A0ABZ0UTL9_9RICK|nr:Fe-S protein assembly chaperone HscA [Candidatus Trichorickettsia mobilis]WPY00432.1 Chaperone protein HscA [Candidatus Trichorickettsia mobilis]
MQIIEISDNLNADTTKNDQQLAVGIDFGTTHSLIAISQQKVPFVIVDQNNLELIPSIITFKNGNFIIGSSNQIENTIFSIKRLLGKSTQEIKQNPALFKLIKSLLDTENHVPKLNLDGQQMILPVIAAEIFKYLKTTAENALSIKITQAVVTVPAYFDDAAKGEVMLAAKIAGLNVIRLMSEPTAAAYAYGLNNKISGCYLIYDLGGGTFDVSILYMQTGILQVIATAGDNMLGGDDIDQLMVDYFISKYQLSYSSKLIIIARYIKELLSVHDQAIMEYGNVVIYMTRMEFEQLILPLLQKTILITQEALQLAGTPELNNIILVGGSTRIPLITSLLQQNFNTSILSEIDPDKAVVFGAALQAENLTIASKNSNSILIDVVPLSLGIELYGGIVEKIILRNSPIPLSITKEFTTYVDNQTAMQFHIVQGEREKADDCRSLARFELKGLPPAAAGLIKVEVIFSIDVDGILSVSALEKTTGISQIVELKPTYGLDDSEVNKILESAYINAISDHHAKLINETIIEAKSLIYHLEKAITETPELLSYDQMHQIQQAITALYTSLTSNNRELIISNINSLQQISELFITQRMNYALDKLIKGKHIDEI